MRVRRWEDGLGVKLPDELVRDLEIKEGDELEIEAEAGRWRVSLDAKRRAALETLQALAVDAPADFAFSRDDAHERER